jgi:HAD superfamily hydrolase (TIGR01549 family)
MDNNKAIFWDFDGVILNSNSIRDIGFELVLEDYPKGQVNLLLKYHRANGGLSRYVKFRYFFEVIRNESVTEEKIRLLAEKFSKIMRKRLVSRENLIAETITFLETNHTKIKMFVTSGSDEQELRFLCSELGISKYFKSIHGSPKPKAEIISELINSYNFLANECCVIGDSINDYEAAYYNGIQFFGFNNLSLVNMGDGYIYSFKQYSALR